MDDRQGPDSAVEAGAALAARHATLGALGRIDDLLGLCDLRRQSLSTTPDVRQRAVVRDSVDEGAHRTVAAKSRQRPPERDRNLLREVVAPAGVRLVAASEPPQGGPELREHALEVPILTHRGCDRSRGETRSGRGAGP